MARPSKANSDTAANWPGNLSVESPLGGRSALRAKPRTALDWVSVIRQGISSAAVDALAKALQATNTHAPRTHITHEYQEMTTWIH